MNEFCLSIRNISQRKRKWGHKNKNQHSPLTDHNSQSHPKTKSTQITTPHPFKSTDPKFQNPKRVESKPPKNNQYCH